MNWFCRAQSVQKLRSLYEHPDDVDLNVGGLLENLLPGTLSGPTYLCIMLEQFYRTRVGDRFFFENAQHEGAFTPGSQTLTLITLRFRRSANQLPRYFQSN